MYDMISHYVQTVFAHTFFYNTPVGPEQWLVSVSQPVFPTSNDYICFPTRQQEMVISTDKERSLQDSFR